MVVGRQPVWAVRRPARACPRDKETPWLWGECAAPTREAGSDLAQPGTQGSGARQLASGCGRGAGCLGQGIQSLPARRGGTHFPGQQLTGQPTRPSMACSAASTPFSPGPGPGSLLPPPPQPWPGAQMGPGGLSYCKRPGRPKAWTLPAGHSHRHLPLPGSAGQGRILRPLPS